MATNLRLAKNAFTPLCEADGTPKSRIRPYLPVLNACAICPARCCRLHVKVSIPDVLHYCHTLRVPFFAGFVVLPTEPGEHSFVLAEDERLLHPMRPWTGHLEIELIRREDGGCANLVNVGGYERCGVYDARPSGCRTYPVSWESDETRGGPGSILCPVPYGIRPDEEARFLEDIEEATERWALHDTIVRAWNDTEPEGGHRLEDFLEFAVRRAADALNVEADVVLTEGTPDTRLHQAMVASGIVKTRG